MKSLLFITSLITAASSVANAQSPVTHITLDHTGAADIATLRFTTDLQNSITDGFVLTSDNSVTRIWESKNIDIDGLPFSMSVNADYDFSGHTGWPAPDLVTTYFMARPSPSGSAVVPNEVTDLGVSVGIAGSSTQSFTLSGTIVSEDEIKSYAPGKRTFTATAEFQLSIGEGDKTIVDAPATMNLHISCEKTPNEFLTSRQVQVPIEDLATGGSKSYILDLSNYDFDFSVCNNLGGLVITANTSKNGRMFDISWKKLIWSISQIED